MKKYIKSTVSIDNLKKQFGEGMSDRDFIEIVNIDPTADYESGKPSKYGVWLFNQYRKGNLTRKDYINVYDALKRFSHDSSKFTYSDLGEYKTVQDFLEDTMRVGNLPLTDAEKAKQLKKDTHNAGDKDKKLLAKDGIWELWQPVTYAGSISLARQGGAKAHWCTAYEGDDSYWTRYSKKGPLYIFINTTDPEEKYQLHIESEQFCDFSNYNSELDGFYHFISDKPNFQPIFRISSSQGCIIKDRRLIRYDGDDKILDLSNLDIYEIDSYVFFRHYKFEEIILPEGLEVIGHYAFCECKYLKKVKLPNTLKIISSYAFYKCYSLTQINLPNSLQIIKDCVFMYCKSLTQITLPINITEIRDNTFNFCISLEQVNLPYRLEEIGTSAFYQCPSLTIINLPRSLKFIGIHAFYDCNNLSDSIKQRILKMNKYAFE